MVVTRSLFSQITGGFVAWPGWEVVHAGFGGAGQIPCGIWAGRALFILGATREAGGAFGRMILSLLGGVSGK